MNKPTVALISDSNFLGVNLVENLLAKNCYVVVFAPDKNEWLAKTQHISAKSSLDIRDEKDLAGYGEIDYVIYVLGFNGSRGIYAKFKRTYADFPYRSAKSLAIFPLEAFDITQSGHAPLNPSLGVIYIGDLFGPRMEVGGDLLAPKTIAGALTKAEITVGVGEVFYPLFVSSVSREIVKWVFSFGPYGKEIFLLGNQTSANDIWRQMAKVVGDLKLYYDNKLPARVIPRGYEIKTLACNLNFVLKETFSWIARSKVPVKKATVKTPLIIALLILLFPILCLGTSASLFYLGYRSFMAGNSERARNMILLSKTPAYLGKAEARVLGYIPLFGRPYEELYFALNQSGSLTDIAVNSIYLADAAKEFFDKILGDEIYDPEKFSREIKTNLDYIYQNLTLIQLDAKSQEERGVYLAKRLLRDFDFDKAKKVSLQGSNIVENLPQILGKNQRRSYLVLFQNNMEIRPTGGFIGSFGILTFEGGRMTDFGVSDVYSADGQLRGHIEPPEQIRKYLGEANWYLRDSNWDPDFPTSARRAEWFLDKEIDREVEGVASVDLSPVKDFLGITGPIYLPDYNMDITRENLYEKTQSEVQEQFFPGTHKKASFLTALSRNLVTEMAQLPAAKKLGVLVGFYKSLESRHIQFYLHDETVQKSISALGWSGEVLVPSCLTDCYPDMVGLVEANLGVNKANYFITRNQNIDVKVLPDKVQRILTLELANSANPALSVAGKYKSYVRLLMPADAQVESVLDVSVQETAPIAPEIYDAKGRHEVGFLTEVLAGQTKRFIISWNSPTEAVADYRLYVRKQAGTENSDRISVVINGNLVYNSNLTEDLWLQKP